MKTYLIIMTIVFGTTGALSLLPAALSVMMFDAPGSTSNPATIIAFLSVFTLPVTCGIGIGFAWMALGKERFRFARWIIWLPILNVLMLLIAVSILEVKYDGNLSGKKTHSKAEEAIRDIPDPLPCQ
jgi:hypothetical protein